MSSYESILLCFLSAWKSSFRKLKASSAVSQHLGVGWAPIQPWKWGLCCWGPCCGTWNVHPAVRRSWGSAFFQIWVFGFLLDMWTTLSTEAKTNLAVPPSFMQVGVWLPQKQEVTSSLCVSQCGPLGGSVQGPLPCSIMPYSAPIAWMSLEPRYAAGGVPEIKSILMLLSPLLRPYHNITSINNLSSS